MSSPEPILPPPWAVDQRAAEPNTWGPPDLQSGAVDRESDPISEAYASGYGAGFSDGRSRAVSELAPVRGLLGALITNLERDQQIARQSAAANIYALALAVSRWLFQQEVSHDPAVVEGLIRRGVDLLPAGTPIEIRVNPDDLKSMGGHLEFREPDGRPLTIHWVADPVLEPGSFTLASPERLVDGRVDMALRSLYERLVGN